MVIDLVSLILLLSVGQGLFLLVLLLHKAISGNRALYPFVFLIGIFLWFQLEFLAVRTPFEVTLQGFFITRFGGWMLVGPLLLACTLSLLKEDAFGWKLSKTLHLAPFVIFALALPFLVKYQMLTNRSIGYGMLTAFDPFNKGVSGLQYIYSGLFLLQFVHAAAYSVFSLRLIMIFKKSHAPNLSVPNIDNIKWFQILHWLIIITLIAVIMLLITMFWVGVYHRQMDYLYVVPFSLLIYFFSFHALKMKDLRLPEIGPKSEIKYRKSFLSMEEAQKWSNLLSTFLANEQPYLDADLRLVDIAKHLHISTHQLSQVINEHLHTSFYDLINGRRIMHAKGLIQQNNDQTLLQIALMSGFNNKNSFNNAFKKHAGMSPSTYRRSVERRI